MWPHPISYVDTICCSETKHGSVAFIWYKKKTVKENGVDVKILKRRPIKLTPVQQDDQGTLVEDWTRMLHSLATGTPASMTALQPLPRSKPVLYLVNPR